MKKIATIFLFLFTLVQAGPAIYSLFSDTTTVFIVDEEKGAEQADTLEKKDKKEYPSLSCQEEEFSYKISTAFHVAEKIHPFPRLDKPTPPPNFC
ncbi:MAG: hypothetical protein SGI96_21970 [Bacteroidota bacterium]|nr:hypothetical protein [Bacteroidota bacterium]